jgi:hypothetical protein
VSRETWPQRSAAVTTRWRVHAKWQWCRRPTRTRRDGSTLGRRSRGRQRLTEMLLGALSGAAGPDHRRAERSRATQRQREHSNATSGTVMMHASGKADGSERASNGSPGSVKRGNG